MPQIACTDLASSAARGKPAGLRFLNELPDARPCVVAKREHFLVHDFGGPAAHLDAFVVRAQRHLVEVIASPLLIHRHAASVASRASAAH
jgi:hypothetical protein